LFAANDAPGATKRAASTTAAAMPIFETIVISPFDGGHTGRHFVQTIQDAVNTDNGFLMIVPFLVILIDVHSIINRCSYAD
jgi:hypothetical protein